MAKKFEEFTTIISVTAGEEVTKNCFGQIAATGNPPVAILADDGEGMGIFLDDGEEGDDVRFLVGGMGTAIRGGSAVVAGDLLDSDASAHATPLESGVGSRRYCAMSYGNPEAENEEFPVLLTFGIDSDTDIQGGL